MMELNGNIISDGPWGGRGGGEWDDGSHSTVKRLIISHGWVIDSIEVEYGDDEGRSVSHGRHGGGGGTRSEWSRLFTHLKLKQTEEDTDPLVLEQADDPSLIGLPMA
uniref:Jacalin-type lectin domain-containing protein n=1 Tax=Nelumbo nucifera TaxID=4432 RepID=A0A822Y753_NELNU|nr:TPA_asm: hypothetical protein HUJ06_028899 [Nelumbo nucifera]